MQPNEIQGVRTALAAEKRAVESELRRLLGAETGVPQRLRGAMRHSLFAGGKRLRPSLLLWTYDALGDDRRRRPRVGRDQVLQAAAALEMLHTYSLIHDDLPAMDDDELRRGQPTCHVAFDEATAILAGDGLQALAFAVLARLGPASPRLVNMIATAAGPGGMVGGQQEDLEAEGGPVSAAQIRSIQSKKTAALIAVALAAGADLAGAKPPLVARIHKAGIAIGMAFQGRDDLLDATGDTARLGKKAGKDAAAGKATWLRVDGVDGARARTERYGGQGFAALEELLPNGPRSDRLLALVQLMWQRDR